MVNLASFFVLLSPVLLVTASVVPIAEVKREPDRPTPVAQEPEYPLYLSKREASGRKTRHLRPVYDKTKREITLPDVGQVATFPSTGIPQPTRGPYGDIRSGGTNEEIDRQNPDYVTPPLSDNGLLVSWFSLSQGSHRFRRQYSQFEVVFLFVTHPPTEWWLDSGADRHRPPTL
jgi:hypothetical protein